MSCTSIKITVPNGTTADWIETQLPQPHSFNYINKYSAAYWNDRETATPYTLTYNIDGYFGTTKGKAYLHDIAGRMAEEMGGTYTTTTDNSIKSTCTLDSFSHLERVQNFNANLENNAFNGSRNNIFEALRYKAYDMKRKGTLNLEALTVYGNQISNGSKHIKYLAPNVFKWVDEKYEPRSQPTMSRVDACKIATAVRVERTKKAFQSAMKYKDIFFRDATLTQLSDLFSISRTSLWKYQKVMDGISRAYEVFSTALTPYGTEMNTVLEVLKKVVKSALNWTVSPLFGTNTHLDKVKVPISIAAPPNAVIIQPNPTQNRLNKVTT